MKIDWFPSADRDLAEIVDFIAGDNVRAALNVDAEILRTVGLLEILPEMGRPGRVAGTRELVVSGTPYIVAYRVREESVEIVGVLHGARRWPKRF